MRQVDRSIVNTPNNLLNLTSEQKTHLSDHKNIRSDIYAHEDVKQALKTIYHDKCYICECYVGDSYDVEHYLPKKSFSHLGYTWGNLHKVCTQCNLAKESDQFFLKDSTSGNITDILLLDPSNPTYYIKDYLSFNLDGLAVLIDSGTDPLVHRKAEHTVRYLNGELKKSQGKPFEHASKLNHSRAARIGAFERSLRENNFINFRDNILNIHYVTGNYIAKTTPLEIKLDKDTYAFLANTFKIFLDDHCNFCSTLRDYCFSAFGITFTELKDVLGLLRRVYNLPIY